MMEEREKMAIDLSGYWLVHHVACQCNSRCKFCIVKYRLKDQEKPLDQVLREMEMVSHADQYYLTGGEPTLRSDLPQIVAHAKKRNDIVRLHSNGRRFKDRSYVQELRSAGLDGAIISFHVTNEEDSRRLIGTSEDYREKVVGIENMLGEGMWVQTNTIAAAYNYQQLPEIIGEILRRFPQINKARITYASFNEHSDRNQFVPLREVRPFIQAVVDKHGAKIEVENVPLCVVDSAQHDAYFDKFPIMVFIGSRGEFFYGPGQRKKFDMCGSCEKDKRCQGVYRNYQMLFDPDKDLKPVQ